MITTYRDNQIEAIRRILNKFSSLEIQLKIQFQSFCSIVLSSEFSHANLERLIVSLSDEKGYSIISDEDEFFVCSFGDDVATVIVSVLKIKQTITVNINL